MKHKFKRIVILSIMPLALAACDTASIQQWGNERGISISHEAATSVSNHMAQRRDSYKSGSIPDMIRTRWAGTGHEEKAVRIAKCESGFNPSAKNRRSSASGVFQIIRGTFAAHASPGMNVFNASDNIEVAYRIWLRSGKSWRQWAC